LNGSFDGEGTLYKENNETVTGVWKNGKIHEKMMEFSNEVGDYYGYIKDGKPSRRGILKYKDGSVYEGEWKDGKYVDLHLRPFLDESRDQLDFYYPFFLIYPAHELVYRRYEHGLSFRRFYLEYALRCVLYHVAEHSYFTALISIASRYIYDAAADDVPDIVLAFRQWIESVSLDIYLQPAYSFSGIPVIDAFELHYRPVLLISYALYFSTDIAGNAVSSAFTLLIARMLKKEDFALLQIRRVMLIERDPDFALQTIWTSDFAY
jgi:hypothetical protein